MDALQKALQDKLGHLALKINPPNPTLKTSVSATNIKDIRAVLRRKYASRSNLTRIFSQWDQSHSGAVSAEDLCAGLSKLGIRASLDEAMAIKASAK